MELSFEENRFLSSRMCAVDCSGGGSGDAKVEGSRISCGESSHGEQIDCAIEAANMLYNMRNEELSKRDREVTDDCGKAAMRRFGHSYELGDLVWGKVRSHPWWPGQIYDEDFALPCARNDKREGHVLVAFFGDNSYGWFDPIELIPFDINYVEKSKQTKDRTFVKAVEEAEDEARRRAAIGLLCHCRNPSSFRATDVKGYVEVDVQGYQAGGLYSEKQIKSARDGFQPVEMLHVLQELAATLHSNVKRSVNWIQNVAALCAYREAVFEEVDGTYAEAFCARAVGSTDSSCALDVQEQLPSQASSDGFLTPKESSFCFLNHKKSALSAGDRVVQRRCPPACIITDYPVGSISTTPSQGHSSKEVTTLREKSIPEKINSTKAMVNREANRVENCDVSKGFKQLQPRFSRVAKTSHHLKNVKVVGRTAPPSDAVRHDKVLVKSGDNLEEKPAVPKCQGEDLQFEEAVTVRKKKRTKRLSLEFPHNHLKNAKMESNSGACSVSSNFVATEQMVDRRSISSENSRSDDFLLPLASDPLHREKHNIPLTDLKFFLKYRSTVYENHFVLAPAAEAELLEGPTTKSPASDVDAKSPYNQSIQDLPSSSKPPKKRLKLHDYANVGPNAISDCGKGLSTEELKKLNDLKELPAEKKAKVQKVVKSHRRSERKTNVAVLEKLAVLPSQKLDTPTRVIKPTMMLIQFPPQSTMPSVSELKARFARFGQLHSAPRVVWKFSTCQVVFKYENDAKAAYTAVDSKSLFGSVKVKCCLQALEVSVTELPTPPKELLRKSLDEVSPFKPISTGDSAIAGSAMTPQHQLLHPGAQPKSCLKKQQSNELDSTVVVPSRTPPIKIMNSYGGSSSCGAININAQNSPLLPVPPNQTSYWNENSEIAHFAEVCYMQCLQPEAENNHVRTTTTNTESVDISTQMLTLLTRCSEIVADLKYSLGYVPLKL